MNSESGRKMLGKMNDAIRKKHLDKRLDCVLEEVNEYLKMSKIGLFKRRRFIRKLKERMRIHLLVSWYPSDSAIGAEDRTFTVKPMHWTFDHAAKHAKMSMVELERYLFGIDCIMVHPEMGLIKYFNLPSKILYDNCDILSNFDIKKMEKQKKASAKPIVRKKGRLYVGGHGNNLENGEKTIKLSTALEELYRNNLNLCNVCKHINTARVMESLEENLRYKIENRNRNGFEANNIEYIMPPIKDENNDKNEEHEYEIIMHKPNNKSKANENKGQTFKESTII